MLALTFSKPRLRPEAQPEGFELQISAIPGLFETHPLDYRFYLDYLI
jgi:hypothetical protein